MGRFKVANLSTYVFALICLGLLVTMFSLVRHVSNVQDRDNRAIGALVDDIDRLQQQVKDLGGVPVVTDEQQAKDAGGQTAAIRPGLFFTPAPSTGAPRSTTPGVTGAPGTPAPSQGTTVPTTGTSTTPVTPTTRPGVPTVTSPPTSRPPVTLIPPIVIFPTQPPPTQGPTTSPPTTRPPIITVPPITLTPTTRAPATTQPPVISLPPVTVTIPPVVCQLGVCL
jgi:hypothetical protein